MVGCKVYFIKRCFDEDHFSGDWFDIECICGEDGVLCDKCREGDDGSL